MTMTSFNDEFLQLFSSCTVHTLQVQCNMDAKPASATQKIDNDPRRFEIAGLIGVTSLNQRATVALCFPKPVFLKILQNLLNEPAKEINVENEDAAAELLNIIFSHVKAIMNKKGHVIQIGIPTIIRGIEIKSHHPKGQKVDIIPFKTRDGEFYAEIITSNLDNNDKRDAAKPGKEGTAFTAAEKTAFALPFIHGTAQTFKVQLDLDVKSGKPFNKVASHQYPFDVAGIVGITSKTIQGSFLLVFKTEVFLKFAGKMFGETYTEIPPGLEDLVTELVNMILGSAKRVLNAQGHGIEMAIPTILRGTELKSSLPKDRKVIAVPFQSELGEFHVEIDIQN
jgi:chemotaxis protein CheX